MTTNDACKHEIKSSIAMK